MKRLVISLILLAVVLSVCYYGIGFVNSNYEKISQELERGTEMMEQGDFEAAKKHCEKAEEIYGENEQYMAAFINHSLLDDIGVCLAAVAPLADKESVPEFFSQCEEAKISLRHIRNDHKFLIGNLF